MLQRAAFYQKKLAMSLYQQTDRQTLLAAAAATAAVAVSGFALMRWRSRNDPPHPGWLPLLGSLPYLREPLEEFVGEKFPEQPVVPIYFGPRRAFCLNSIEAMKEAFVAQGDKFLARQDGALMKYMTGEEGGIIIASGKKWRDYRRFTLQTLRDFGFGRQGAEEIISNEARLLCDLIDSNSGSAFDTVPLLSTAISNVICVLVFGSRLASEDPKFERILEIFKALTQTQSSQKMNLSIAIYTPYFKRVPQLLALLKLLRRKQFGVFEELICFCRQQMELHRQEMHDVSQAKDYIEAHLKHQETHEGFNDIRLTLSIVDLFIAGTDTTSHTTRWAILYMIDNPDVAERVFQEINSVIGTERQVTMKDKGSLHYTNAVIEEVHRMASLAPLGVVHQSTEESVVCGCRIPANSIVFPNIFHIHRSPRLFPQPEKFRPERYLNSDGHFRPSEHVVAFGVGKRSCLGESLARMELLVFFATLVQRFTFSLEPSERRSVSEIMNKAEASGGIRAPAEHRILFTPRQ